MASYCADEEESIASEVSKVALDDDKQLYDKPEQQYFPLKMVADRKTEMYVKFAKVMVIIQGPYTDLRSRVSPDALKSFPYASRVLSDDTYRKDRCTICKYEETEEFYEYFRQESRRSLENCDNLLLLDSTMSNKQQNSYYCAIALRMKYVVLVVPPIVTGLHKENWPSRSQAASFRQSDTFIQAATQFQHLFCGWYLHDVDSDELRHLAALYLHDCIEGIPDFKDMFSKVPVPGGKKVTKDMDDQEFASAIVSRYFKLDEKRQDLAYCVTKHFNNALFSMNEYFKNEDVQKNYGKMSKLMISGFVVSPHMIAARVRLNFHQKSLWDMPDELDENVKSPICCVSELVDKMKDELPQVEINLVSSKANPTIVNSHTCHDPTQNIHPTAKGRACHIVLGKAPGAPARNVDYDVQFALRRLRNSMKAEAQGSVANIPLSRCVVRRLGKYWLIDLNEMLSVDGFFASCVKPYPYENAMEGSNPHTWKKGNNAWKK
ncbi:hypothetical protein JTE90_028782 [Oedothorax gibbosus]|uniref:Cyclic nucleotide phosphodiesterase catalytic domain-containing protein n=1 Tax=Oedothorax gibbosus TaxID=931172 RepID=A0AAV6VZJ9_9ARAC|nr:hypothetical protein JTE90_028782 [Oedothorax gibbosus]